ncbi:MAG: hypothetical protein Q8S57_00050 [Methanoregula sp.]|nr:hypothetical protein [Methanoregula sp.]
MASTKKTDRNNETIFLPGEKKDIIYRLTYLPIQLYLQWNSDRLSSGVVKQKKMPEPDEPAKNFAIITSHMNAICSENGIRYYAVLQPMNGIGNRTLTRSDNMLLKVVKNQKITQDMSRFDFFIRYYDAVRRIMSKSPFFIDSTNCFDNETVQVFSDTVHFSDKGQRIIAEALSDIILNGEDK